jgi:hypothetical protein
MQDRTCSAVGQEAHSRRAGRPRRECRPGAQVSCGRSGRSGSISRPVSNVVPRCEASPTAHIRERPASIGWIRWRSRYSSAPSRDTAISCAIDAISASALCDDSRTHVRLPAYGRSRGRVDERRSTLFLHSPKPPRHEFTFSCVAIGDLPWAQSALF